MSETTKSKSGPADTPKWRRALRVWWPRTKTAGKGVIGVAGLGAAVVAIYAWFPLARDTAWPELKEYATLESLYAGASVTFFDDTLGPPSIIHALSGENGLTERLYVKKDYIVTTLATPDGQTKLYSVLSCSPAFKPSFDFRGNKITLQDKPLAAQMPSDRPPAALYFVQPTTVSSPTFFFELTEYTSNASGNRGSGYGVNGSCKNLPSTAGGDMAPGYEGPPAQAPREISDYRSRTSANFYVELWDRSLANVDNKFVIPFDLVTPSREELPPGWPKS
jgi:hypothetical protein